ncbi:hypothetical protein GIB67_041825, partial [Kingdonia uniflora]
MAPLLTTLITTAAPPTVTSGHSGGVNNPIGETLTHAPPQQDQGGILHSFEPTHEGPSQQFSAFATTSATERPQGPLPWRDRGCNMETDMVSMTGEIEVAIVLLITLEHILTRTTISRIREVMRGEMMTRFILSTYEDESFAKIQTLHQVRNQFVDDYVGDFYMLSSRVVLSESEAHKLLIKSLWIVTDKKVVPKAANDVKLISGGKILENNRTVGQCKTPYGELPGGVITMHVVVQPSLVKTKS